jgi:hypothetical protein
MTDFATPADFLAVGLDLPLPPTPAVDVPPGVCCAITGQPIGHGYPVADMVTDATAEFLDCFRGGVHGYVSTNAARCFKSSNPRAGNPCARSVVAFEDMLHNPLIAQEQAALQERACWSELVRSLWPERAGQRCLMILTTDTKKRLWIRARVGTLGNRTPILVYDSGTPANEVLLLDWPRLLDCLDVVEHVYSIGFPKAAIRASLFEASKIAGMVGLRETHRFDRQLSAWRGTPEMIVATLIAQKHAVEPPPVAPAQPVPTTHDKEPECLPLFTLTD